MKEHPIIFSSEMVRAIFDGRKTMTRRIMNPQPFEYDRVQTVPGITSQHYPMVRFGLSRLAEVSVYEWEKVEHGEQSAEVLQYCPYGQIGDRLWVREAWREIGSGMRHDRKIPSISVDVVYSADADWDGPFRPSIHMPRWASRITLEITNIRVERLQEITEEDCIKEGIKIIKGLAGDFYKDYSRKNAKAYTDPIFSFRSLWDSINGKEYPWGSNPWVWVITFRRIVND